MESSQIPGDAVVLHHPSGAQVHLVGVAHVSAQAPKDVAEVITASAPHSVVLELDKERYERLLRQALSSEDKYGLDVYRSGGRLLTAAKLVVVGSAVDYLLGLTYVVVGALLGAPAGAEFVVAHALAQELGAVEVLGDRDQRVTLQRLAEVSTALRRGQKMYKTLPEPGQATDAEGGGKKRLDTHSVWLKLLQEGGCEDGQQVLEAFKRILQRGVEREADIDLQDVAAVRGCGRKLVENFRQRAIKEGDSALQSLEVETLAQVKDAAGLAPNIEALHQVFGHERDIVIARKLWESAAQSGGRPVVGVVGAAHIPGITKLWPSIGTPEMGFKAQLLEKPSGSRQPSLWPTTLLLGGALGYITWKRPRLALGAVTLTALVASPFIAGSTVMVTTWERFAERVVKAAERLDAESGE